MGEREQHKVIVVDGIKLDVCACLVEKGKWELSIQNVMGIRSVWMEWFDSAETAIQAGLKAVETEGAKEFMRKDGFEYLFDD